MFYPLEPLPTWLRLCGFANPMRWHVDVRRLTVGLGHPSTRGRRSSRFVLFTRAGFAATIRSRADA